MSTSSSPELELISKKTKKSKDKIKKGKKSSQPDDVVTPHGKNKSIDPHWSFEPPSSAVLVDYTADPGEFDWDTVKDDEDLELWVVRVPEGVRSKYLQDVKLEASTSVKTTKVGSVDRKHTSYDVWSLGEDQTEHVGGEEIKGLSCLLPRQKKGGKLYQAPKPIARHLVVTARPALPTLESSLEQSTSNSASPVCKNPPRPRYPRELLKHRFMPLGSLAPTADSVDSPESMDVDQVEALLGVAQADQDLSAAEKTEPVEKKRKGDNDVAGKSKKAKKTKTVI
ncbi:hypothetical protein AcW1_005281 [Taiwanofungus camphoratus]|nr:hypothetical protein AcW2_004051 [Antrodia cinnamomea]KAI0956653.1 hypothetical protein AcW1_005281 [Antrodia cinnamomea]